MTAPYDIIAKRGNKRGSRALPWLRHKVSYVAGAHLSAAKPHRIADDITSHLSLAAGGFDFPLAFALRGVSLSVFVSGFTESARAGVFKGDAVQFGIAQPLRVESGKTQVRLPSGRTKVGDVVYDDFDASLVEFLRARGVAWGNWCGDRRLARQVAKNPVNMRAFGGLQFGF